MSFEEWWKTKDYPTRCKGNCKEAYEAGLHADVHTDNSAVIAELEKEARKDVDSLNGVVLVSSTMVAIDRYGAYKIGRYDGYVAGAEPREKRIAELEAQIEKMKLALIDIKSNTDDVNIEWQIKYLFDELEIKEK